MEPLSALADTIGDVGYWRWWTRSESAAIQLEFGGVQLARPGADVDAVPVPIGVIALRFAAPSAFAFLTRLNGGADVPGDWPARLAADTLDSDNVSTALSYELFSLDDETIAEAVLAVPHRAESVIGRPPDLAAWRGAPARLAFWAGAVGASILADSLEILTHEGPLDVRDVPTLRHAWWTYWRAYWARRGTKAALPYDGACEVTIPVAAE